MALADPSSETAFPADPPADLPLVFLIGMPRSGTTWVTWLLTHHPQVVTFRHSGIFFCFEHLQKWWTRDIKFTRGANASEDGYGTSLSTDVLKEKNLHEALRSIGGHVFRNLRDASPGARAIVDQTPEHIALLPLIRDVFPEARFLHVVRDPRAVYSSIRSAAEDWAAPGSFVKNPIPVARRWRDLLRGARELRDSNADTFELVYEKIHADPESELRRVHEWIGLDTDAELVRQAVEASRIDKLREKGGAPKGFFRRGSAGGWREELSSAEIRAIEHEAGDEMKEWGYALDFPTTAKKPLRTRTYDRITRFVQDKRGGRVMRAVDGALARANRALQIMRSQ